MAGGADSAFTIAQHALDLAQEHRERDHEAQVHRLLASIEQERESPAFDRAESGYRTALALAELLGMRPRAAHRHVGLGNLYRRRGSRETAQMEAAAARALFRSLDVTFWPRYVQ